MLTKQHSRKTVFSATDTLPKEVCCHQRKKGVESTILRRLPPSNKRHRLDPHYIESFPAPHILAPHRVIAANHVTLRLGKTRPIAVIGPARQLRLLPPHHPVNLILPLLPAVRTCHHMRPLLRFFIKKIALFHTHLILSAARSRQPPHLQSCLTSPLAGKSNA
jgi:hypothetical protein